MIASCNRTMGFRQASFGRSKDKHSIRNPPAVTILSRFDRQVLEVAVVKDRWLRSKFHAEPLGNAFGEHGTPTLDRGDSASIRAEFTDFAQQLRISRFGADPVPVPRQNTVDWS